MQTFFTADWHLGDERIEILGRPFKDQEEMLQVILSNYNQVVSPEDKVYMLGDMFHKDGGCSPSVLEDFNGDITLIRGNHDILKDKDYSKYVENIVVEGDGVELEVEGIPCWLTHYPSTSRKDLFNLVGHIHGTWRVQKNMLNVGVDVHHFLPVSSKQVAFYFKAINEFYDEDVWCSAHSSNSTHSYRGKSGTYFKK